MSILLLCYRGSALDRYNVVALDTWGTYIPLNTGAIYRNNVILLDIRNYTTLLFFNSTEKLYKALTAPDRERI